MISCQFHLLMASMVVGSLGYASLMGPQRTSRQSWHSRGEVHPNALNNGHTRVLQVRTTSATIITMFKPTARLSGGLLW
jgi:hypothetical protein